MRFNVYMPDDLRYTLRKAALEERTAATKLGERLIADYLARRKKKSTEHGGIRLSELWGLAWPKAGQPRWLLGL